MRSGEKWWCLCFPWVDWRGRHPWKREKKALVFLVLQRFSYTALVSMIHLSYFGLMFSMNFKAGFCFRNRRIECQKILKYRATQYKITTKIWALDFCFIMFNLIKNIHTMYIYRVTQKKCPIRILISNLFWKSDFTFPHGNLH